MSQFWHDLTIGQAAILIAVVFFLLWMTDRMADAIRRRTGSTLGRGWEHCEHCDAVERIDEQLEKLATYAFDSNTALGEIRDSVSRTANAIDELAADEKPVALR